MIDEDLPAPVFDHPPAFSDRFAFNESSAQVLDRSALRSFARTLSVEMESVQRAKTLLASKLRDFRGEVLFIEGRRGPGEAPVPFPRPRPVQADLATEKVQSDQADGQTFIQKITALFAGETKLASLLPDADLSDHSSSRSPLGVDDHTAIYDISARIVYMPGGSRLEAHSGLGALRDSPEHVSQRDVGATPPAVYDLKPREQLFHGVQALRMIPAGGYNTLGRDGLLTHGYMLGPDGDSNGCVSIKDYDKFLAAFQNGEVKRLVVVTSLSSMARPQQVRS